VKQFLKDTYHYRWGWIIAALVAPTAVLSYIDGDILWGIAFTAFGLLNVFLYQCPKGWFYRARPVSPKLDIINGGFEPVETPSEGIDEYIEAHRKQCVICNGGSRR